MIKQLDARVAEKSITDNTTTKAIKRKVESYSNYYSEKKIGYKPFLPGTANPAPTLEVGEYGLYAGVDEYGFLLGVISMTGLIEKVENSYGTFRAKIVDSYSGFRKPNQPSEPEAYSKFRDTDGTPKYAKFPKAYKEIDFKERRHEDVERISALVPLDDVRVGDLVIRINDPNKDAMHVGIVVSVGKLLGFENKLDETIVVHVGEGFKAVSICTLGILKWMGRDSKLGVS